MERHQMKDRGWKIIAIDDHVQELAIQLFKDPTIASRFERIFYKDGNCTLRNKSDNPGYPCSIDIVGYQVSMNQPESRSANAIIRRIEAERYDVAFVDYCLSAQGVIGNDEAGFQRGLRLIKTLSTRFPEMPIVVISARASLRDAQAEEVMNSCVEIFDKSKPRDLNEIRSIFCENEAVFRLLEKNVMLRALRQMRPEGGRKLPLKVRYDLNARRIELSGSLFPFRWRHFGSLAVMASFTERSVEGVASCSSVVRKYGALLRRRWAIEVGELQSRGVEVLSLAVVQGERTILETDFRWLAEAGRKPVYLDYLKNIRFLDEQFLYAPEPRG